MIVLRYDRCSLPVDDFKADIWSLGITILELCEGHPPYYSVHPMRAIFMISMKPAPTLQDESKWSPQLLDFVARCLVREPDDRASSEDLLGHPWLAADVDVARGEAGSEDLRHLVEEKWDNIQSSRVVRRKSIAMASPDQFRQKLDNHALRNKVSAIRVSEAIARRQMLATAAVSIDDGATLPANGDDSTLNFNYNDDTFKMTVDPPCLPNSRRRSSADSNVTEDGTLNFSRTVRRGSVFADGITETYKLDAKEAGGIDITEIAMVEAIQDFKDKKVYTGVNPGDIYQRSKLLGKGSYGVVYRGSNTFSGEEVAIKVLPCPHPSDVGTEIEILRKLDSPFIVNFNQAFLGNKELWIVMEYCAGGSLADVIRISRQTLNEPQLVGVTASCILGLTYLHSLLGIHRDIKAGNILLTAEGQAKLADFGVSAQLKQTLQQRNTLIGTPFWMAPEVIQENDYDYKADIWSLGITILEMCEGRPPHFDLHPMRAVFLIPMAQAPTLQEPEKWSATMVDFLSKCLVKDPQGRASTPELLNHEWINGTCITIQEQLTNVVLQDLAAVAIYNIESMNGDIAEDA